MFLELLTENWISLIVLVAMVAAIFWLLRDDAIFWGDCERASKGLSTKKYFKK